MTVWHGRVSHTVNEAQAAWAVEFGQIDGVTAAITQGKLVMPKHSAPSQQTALRNHPFPRTPARSGSGVWDR